MFSQRQEQQAVSVTNCLLKWAKENLSEHNRIKGEDQHDQNQLMLELFLTRVTIYFGLFQIQEAICHEGSKATRAIYLRNGLVFTTGFSKMSERQYSLRAPGHLNDPIVMVELDTSNGVMFPLYDADTNMVYLCGKVNYI